MSVSVLVGETRPLPAYTFVFRHPGLPVGGKHSAFHSSSCVLIPVGVINLYVCVKSEEEVSGEKKTLYNILNLDCNT